MMIYTFSCPCCSLVREELMEVSEPHVLKCECGTDMDRYWQADLPAIQGDTCAGCSNQTGYDESLGIDIRSRQHRKEEMKKRGLEPYVPEPEQKAFRKELAYVHKHGKGDPAVGPAMTDIRKESGRARMKQAIKEVNKKH